jgi:hypothetical protein
MRVQHYRSQENKDCIVSYLPNGLEQSYTARQSSGRQDLQDLQEQAKSITGIGVTFIGVLQILIDSVNPVLIAP